MEEVKMKISVKYDDKVYTLVSGRGKCTKCGRVATVTGFKDENNKWASHTHEKLVAKLCDACLDECSE